MDPTELSSGEMERMTRKFVQRLGEQIGSQRDIPAPDINTNAQVMAWVMDEYSKIHGFYPGGNRQAARPSWQRGPWKLPRAEGVVLLRGV